MDMTTWLILVLLGCLFIVPFLIVFVAVLMMMAWQVIESLYIPAARWLWRLVST